MDDVREWERRKPDWLLRGVASLLPMPSLSGSTKRETTGVLLAPVGARLPFCDCESDLGSAEAALARAEMDETRGGAGAFFSSNLFEMSSVSRGRVCRLEGGGECGCCCCCCW